MSKQPSLYESDVYSLAAELQAALAALPVEERIEALNFVRRGLHEISPFKNEPVDCVLWIPVEEIQANEYNPNTVAPPEMKLLSHSIEKDGYTQPIVGSQFSSSTQIEIVDGFHRNRVGRENPRVRERLHGYLPVTLIQQKRGDVRDRMAATIRHNRARGVHGVLPMSDIVADLIRRGWGDEEVAKELGMDADEVLRFKQVLGLPELFRHNEYSKSWE